MGNLRRKKSTAYDKAVGKAVAGGMDRGIAAVRQRLETESPEMLIAIDAIESSNSIEDLDLALQVLCDFYEPLFEQIIDLGYSKRVQYLLLYDGSSSGQASKKAHELVRANTGLHLKPGEFADRRNEIADRDTPGYSFPEKPMPPRVQCRNIIVAIQSYS